MSIKNARACVFLFFNRGAVVLITEKISAKRHSLMRHTEGIFPFYDARSRALTDTSSFKH